MTRVKLFFLKKSTLIIVAVSVVLAIIISIALSIDERSRMQYRLLSSIQYERYQDKNKEERFYEYLKNYYDAPKNINELDFALKDSLRIDSLYNFFKTEKYALPSPDVFYKLLTNHYISKVYKYLENLKRDENEESYDAYSEIHLWSDSEVDFYRKIADSIYAKSVYKVILLNLEGEQWIKESEFYNRLKTDYNPKPQNLQNEDLGANPLGLLPKLRNWTPPNDAIEVKPIKTNSIKIKQQRLIDFSSIIEEKSKLTQTELFEIFPEFGNRKDLLQAAMDYHATFKSGTYGTLKELNSKFPEFEIESIVDWHISSLKKHRFNYWQTVLIFLGLVTVLLVLWQMLRFVYNSKSLTTILSITIAGLLLLFVVVNVFGWDYFVSGLLVFPFFIKSVVLILLC